MPAVKEGGLTMACGLIYPEKEAGAVYLREMRESVKVISVLIHWQANIYCIKIQESRTAAERAKT